MHKVKQIWEETAKRLEKVYYRREAENISYLLLEDVFGLSKEDIILEIHKEVSQNQLDSCIERLLRHEPIQYVTGIADFYGRKFKLRPGALIPRPETEELCNLIIRENRMLQPKVLDVGVGSGCIAITLAIETNGSVVGTDVSKEAIAIAKKNASDLNAKVLFIENDILNEELPERELDILVSNPPYIPRAEQVKMRENVVMHEPELALFVPDDDPIIFYKRIADLGLTSLKSGGKLYFEIHEDYGDHVLHYLKLKGYSDVKVHQDMQGKDRMVKGLRV